VVAKSLQFSVARHRAGWSFRVAITEPQVVRCLGRITVKNNFARTTLSRALTTALLGMAAGTGWAQTAPPAPPAASPAPATQAAPASGDDAVKQLDTVTVSGYRRSIQFSTDAKRDSVTFSDTVFAEDIGKFPDMNIAESLNRIPGVQLARDVNGEGLNIAIRGLGTSFTKTTLNGASIATASIGLNAQNQNREVDLNLFPTEFFTQLTVSKTPTASMLEGGVSGVVDMRSARPFDRPGPHLTYQVQGDWNSTSEKTTPRGALMGSWTNQDGTFGALFGVASVRSKLGVEGFETIGWTNPGLTYAQCGLTPPAELAYRRAAELSPGYPGPPFFNGLALARSGDRASAVAIWQQILKTAPKDAEWRPLVEQGVAALSGSAPGAPSPSQPPKKASRQ